MEAYVEFVTNHPFISAAIQFGILGTAGEIISLIFKNKNRKTGWTFNIFVFKILAWALLGIVIKYGFIGMQGFTRNLFAYNLIPGFFMENTITYAFLVSVFTNLFFGPQMMAFHRIEDNIIERKSGFVGIKKAWFTLLWFWIPAHTVTFALPEYFQIGLAAIWGLALGIIMGATLKN